MLRFFNWFYFFVSIGVQDNVLVYVLAVTVLVYVQDNVGLDCRRHRRQGEGEAAPQQGMQVTQNWQMQKQIFALKHTRHSSFIHHMSAHSLQANTAKNYKATDISFLT